MANKVISKNPTLTWIITKGYASASRVYGPRKCSKSEYGTNAVRHKDEFLVSRIILASKYRLKLLLAGTDEISVQVKVIPQQAEVAQGVPGRLWARIFLKFDTTRVVGHQPYSPAAFTPEENPGTHFQRLSRPQGTWFRRREPRKNPQ